MKNFLFAILFFAVSAKAANHIVQMTGSTFSPATLTIAKGDSVTWTNLDFVTHNVINGPGCPSTTVINFGSGSLSHNQTYTFTFNLNAGSYAYYCTFHCGTMNNGLIVVTNPPNVAPSVSITNPVNNAVFANNASISIGASASDSDGSVTNVAFAINGGIFTNRASVPYVVATNLSAGTYTLSAIASDNNGARATNSVSVTVNAPPTLSLSPSGPYSVNEDSTLSFAVNGSDSDALTIASTNLPSGATLTGTGNSRTFTWTPSYGQSYASPYSINFSANDGINSSVSSTAMVTVNPVFTPINLTNFVRNGNQVQFHVSGLRLTRTNFIQTSSDLIGWTSVQTNIANSTSLDFVDTNAVATKHYRLLELR